jgi:ATP-dependent Lhr-like helicase
MLRRRSLAKLRHEVEPVDQAVLGRFAATWQGVAKRRHGTDALLDTIEQLQGAPLPASLLESELLPARLDGYDPGDLDAVMAAGEIVWTGVEPLGERDGRIALYLADHLPRLLPPVPARGATTAGRSDASDRSERESAILDYLQSHGASFFGPLHGAVGGGYPAETIDAIWNLVWAGLITNDTLHALRAFTQSRAVRRRRLRRGESTAFRSRRLVPPAGEGRWSLVRPQRTALRGKADATPWAAATAQQLLARHGVLTREAVLSESVTGGFGVIYPVLKAMEESGRLRRGYFVAGLGATQFALPGALDLLRSLRDAPDTAQVAVLAATDPASPYGATLKWPAFAAGESPTIASARRAPRRAAGGRDGAASARHAAHDAPDHPRPASSGGQAGPETGAIGRGPTRSVGATVILVDGALAAYLSRGDRQLLTWIPEAEPQRSRAARAVAHVLIERARSGRDSPRGMLIEEIDGALAQTHMMAPFLGEAGFIAGAMGMQATFLRHPPPDRPPPGEPPVEFPAGEG